MTDVGVRTPYEIVAETERPVEAVKSELLRVTRSIEHAALQSPPQAVAATLQDVRYVTARTRQVYLRLAESGTRARLYARGLQTWLADGVTGVPLDDDDPLVDQWVVVVPGPSPVVFAATDLRDPDCDVDFDRCFAYAVSRDPDVVAACARALGI